MSINELRYFISRVKSDYNKNEPSPQQIVHQKVLKELKQEDRKVLLEIIQNPEAKDSDTTASLANRIKALKSAIEDESKPFESRRLTGNWKSFCRIMKNIFDDRTSTTRLFKAILNSPQIPDSEVK